MSIAVSGTESDLHRAVATIVARLGPVRAWDDVLRPALHEIEGLWFDGHVGLGRERVAHDCVSRHLRLSAGPRSTATVDASRAVILLVGVGRDRHWSGYRALHAALIAAAECESLGPAMPVSMLARAAERLRPDTVVAWSGGMAPRAAALGTSLATLDPSPRLILAGPGWSRRDLADRGHLRTDQLQDIVNFATGS